MTFVEITKSLNESYRERCEFVYYETNKTLKVGDVFPLATDNGVIACMFFVYALTRAKYLRETTEYDAVKDVLELATALAAKLAPQQSQS
jgi:hypothetical protein